jgi:hypothetical protein
MKIKSTVKPDIRLSFNDWMKYIKEQVNKTKK